jgi:uncharacterized SAM-binding protein YcdF (DUF218 family)
VSVAEYVLPAMAAGALAACVAGVVREPRRLSNAVWLGFTVVLFGLWGLVRALDVGWLAPTLLSVLAVAAILLALALPLALIANGVVMLRREGHSAANLLSLATGVALFVLGALFFAPVGTGPSVAIGALLLLAGYLGFLFASLLAYSLVYSRLGRRPGVDVIIVLGAGLADGRVPPLLAGRLDRGIRLYQREITAGNNPKLVTSGGQGPDEPTSEAVAMRDYLVDHGIPAGSVLLEPDSTTTEENLRFSMDVVGRAVRARRVVAVTNNYHVFRTAVLCRRLGLTVNVTGCHTAWYFLPSAFLREFVALLVQYKRTNIAAGALLVATFLVLVRVTA